MVEYQLPKLVTRVRFPSLALKTGTVSMNLKRLYIILLLFFITGCASVKTQEDKSVTGLPEPDRLGVYHKVNKGETLWRIAKTYNIPIDDIIRSNNIPNAAQVEVNQLVFIPNAFEVKKVVIDTADEKDDFIWPVKGKVIEYFNRSKGHKGINIEAEAGSMVNSTRKGTVVFADYLPGYGNTVIIDHADGYHSVYSNNDELQIKLGDYVNRNSPIAKIGSGDKLAYLHFQIRKHTIEDNPLFYLP